MKTWAALGVLFIVFGYGTLSIRADGVLLSWSASSVPGVTEQSFSDAKQLAATQIPAKNLAVKSWADAFLLMVAGQAHREDKSLLAALAAQITDADHVQLQGTSRLIIWERITTGDIMFEGKGYQVDDDLFSVAGRANWVLRNLTKKNFGIVRPKTSSDELAKLQQAWKHFLAGEPADEYKNPYPTDETGLSEIHSREALQALIVSLKPSAAKETLTKNCLHQLYKLDQMPADPNDQAHLCDPDTLTHRYLALLTGEKDRHEYDWWKAWWDKNQTKLEWKSDTATFSVKN